MSFHFSRKREKCILALNRSVKVEQCGPGQVQEVKAYCVSLSKNRKETPEERKKGGNRELSGLQGGRYFFNFYSSLQNCECMMSS